MTGNDDLSEHDKAFRDRLFASLDLDTPELSPAEAAERRSRELAFIKDRKQRQERKNAEPQPGLPWPEIILTAVFLLVTVLVAYIGGAFTPPNEIRLSDDVPEPPPQGGAGAAPPQDEHAPPQDGGASSQDGPWLPSKPKCTLSDSSTAEGVEATISVLEDYGVQSYCGLGYETLPEVFFAGDRVTVVCQVRNGPFESHPYVPEGYPDEWPVWSKLSDGRWVSDLYLDTPKEEGDVPPEGIPLCGDSF